MNSSQQDTYTCPSFSSYSSPGLAEIAVKVSSAAAEAAENSNDAMENAPNIADEDFEFVLVREDEHISGEESFCDGQIGLIFPVFNRDLLLNNDDDPSPSGEDRRFESNAPVPLGKLFIESCEEENERDSLPSCSSSEADEVDNVPAGTYSVWRPKAADQPSPSRCKKSNSTGSTSKRRWKLSDLLRRSNSDGKDSFVFFTPKKAEAKLQATAPAKAKAKGAGAPGSPSPHEALYVRNRTTKEVDKKKSFLPYRRDLVGFFLNVRMGR